MKQNTPDSLRARLKQARSQISAEQQSREGLLLRARLFTWVADTQDEAAERGARAPQVIGAYWPLENEPDLRPLMRQWDQGDITVALPVMAGANRPLLFVPWHVDMDLVSGAFGVMEPPTRETVIPDILLVPTLGFTRNGDRIGYGKGYYDHTLADLAKQGHHPVTIGIAWNEGAIETLDADYEPQAHDFRLDAILTPNGWADQPPGFGRH